MMITEKQQEKLDALIKQFEDEITFQTRLNLKLYYTRPMDKIEPQLIENKVNDLIDRMCAVWGVELKYICLLSRSRDRVTMRSIIMYAIRTNLKGYSLTAIAKKLGGFDHTSVLYNIKSVAKHIAMGDDYFMGFYEPVKHIIDGTDKA